MKPVLNLEAPHIIRKVLFFFRMYLAIFVHTVTKFNIHILITTIGSIPLPMDY